MADVDAKQGAGLRPIEFEEEPDVVRRPATAP